MVTLSNLKELIVKTSFHLKATHFEEEIVWENVQATSSITTLEDEY